MLAVVVSIYGVSIKWFHIGPSGLVARFKTGVEISPLLESILAHLQNFTEIQEKLIIEVITLVKVIPAGTFMFKVKNRNTRMAMASFCCLYC